MGNEGRLIFCGLKGKNRADRGRSEDQRLQGRIRQRAPTRDGRRLSLEAIAGSSELRLALRLWKGLQAPWQGVGGVCRPFPPWSHPDGPLACPAPAARLPGSCGRPARLMAGNSHRGTAQSPEAAASEPECQNNASVPRSLI